MNDVYQYTGAPHLMHEFVLEAWGYCYTEVSQKLYTGYTCLTTVWTYIWVYNFFFNGKFGVNNSTQLQKWKIRHFTKLEDLYV